MTNTPEFETRKEEITAVQATAVQATAVQATAVQARVHGDMRWLEVDHARLRELVNCEDVGYYTCNACGASIMEDWLEEN